MIRGMTNNRHIALGQALGIEIWAPRKTLRGAAVGHLVADVSAAQQSLPQDKRQTQPQKKAALQSRGSALAQSLVVEKSTSDNNSAPAESAEAQIPSHTKAEAFQLFAAVHQGVLIVDDISHLRFTASAYSQWLNALFTAMGCSTPLASLSASNRISWPLAEYASQYDPADMVSAWLKKKLVAQKQVQAASCALVMGEQTARFLTVETKLDAITSLVKPLGGLPALLSLDSAQLWQQPGAKSNLWRQLQMLQKSVANANARVE
jgi:hypothetical protein